MGRLAYSAALAAMVASCGSPKPPELRAAGRTPPRPQQSEAPNSRPAPAIPRLRQGATPTIEVTITGPRGEFTGDDVEQARVLEVVVTGPEPSREPHVLEVPEHRRCPEQRTCTYYKMPFATQTLALQRRVRVGVYAVSVRSPAGLRLEVSPPGFEIIAGEAIPIAGLPRTGLGYDRITGSGAVVAHGGGLVVASNAGDALYIDGPGKRRALELDGGAATLASSGAGFAVGYADRDGTPKLSLVDPQLRRQVPVTLGAKRSTLGLLASGPPVEVAWDPARSEWLAVWPSREAPTRAEAARLARQHRPIPFALQVARLARVSRAGALLRTIKAGDAERVSNVVSQTAEQAFVTVAPGRWRLTLVRVRGGKVIGRTAINRLVDCPRLTRRVAQLARDSRGYVALLIDREAIPPLDGPPEEPRLSLVRFDKTGASVSLAAGPDRIESARLAAVDGRLWLIYARGDRALGRSVVYAAALAPDLAVEKTIAVDDGYHRVRDLQVAGDRLAIFRAKGSAVVELPAAAAIKTLPAAPAGELGSAGDCRAKPRTRPARGRPRVPRPARARPFRLRVHAEGGHTDFQVRKALPKRQAASCLSRAPRSFAGVLRVRLVISPEGSVLGVVLQRPDLPGELRACLQEALGRGAYPAAREPTRVRLEWSR